MYFEFMMWLIFCCLLHFRVVSILKSMIHENGVLLGFWDMHVGLASKLAWLDWWHYLYEMTVKFFTIFKLWVEWEVDCRRWYPQQMGRLAVYLWKPKKSYSPDLKKAGHGSSSLANSKLWSDCFHKYLQGTLADSERDSLDGEGP